MSNLSDFKLPKMATIKETVMFLNESAEKAGVKNALTENAVRQLALSNQIVHVRAGKKILINIDKLVEFLNTGTTLASKVKDVKEIKKVKEFKSKTNDKYKTISPIYL